MKTKSYRNGTFRCQSYMKTVGNGWEVGFYYGKKLAFVGNFIHSSEANRWWGIMNREIRTFSQRFKCGPSAPKTWFGHFLSSHLYHRYYAFLDTCFTSYQRQYRGAVTKDTRRYRTLARQWSGQERRPFLRAA